MPLFDSNFLPQVWKIPPSPYAAYKKKAPAEADVVCSSLCVRAGAISLRGFEPRQGLQGLFLLMSGFSWLGVSRCGTPGREEVLYPVLEIGALLDL